MQRIIVLLLLCFSFSGAFAQDGWILQKSGTKVRLNSVASADGQNVVAVGENSTIVVSHTAGVTWRVLDDFRAKQSTQGKHLNGVTAISDNIFCTVGLVDSIFRSTDKGDTWLGAKATFDACTYGAINRIIPPLSAIDFDSLSGFCVAVGPGPEAIFSSDFGLHWDENATKQQKYFDFSCVSIVKGNVLAATNGNSLGTGNPGHTFISTDQGDDWQSHWVQKNIEIYGCDMNGWILVGPAGTIFHSPNKGSMWDSIWGGTNVNLNDVHFGNIARGYIVGDNGTILYTTNAGYSWVRQFCPTNENLRSIHMSDPFHGFICGDHGVILTTQNGGYFDNGVDPLPSSSRSIRTYPNPFSSRTTIEVAVEKRGYLRLRIYNMFGEEVATLAGGEFDPGMQIFEWNAGDAASGIYLCRLEMDGRIFSTQVTLEK